MGGDGKGAASGSWRGRFGGATRRGSRGSPRGRDSVTSRRYDPEERPRLGATRGRCDESPTMPVVIRGLEAWLRDFGGGSRELLLDPMPSALLRDGREEGGGRTPSPDRVCPAPGRGGREPLHPPRVPRRPARRSGDAGRPGSSRRRALRGGGRRAPRLGGHRAAPGGPAASRLPAIPTRAEFAFSFQPSMPREQVDSLPELGFVERRENLVFLGPPAVGGTPLAIAAAERGGRVGSALPSFPRWSLRAPAEDRVDLSRGVQFSLPLHRGDSGLSPASGTLTMAVGAIRSEPGAPGAPGAPGSLFKTPAGSGFIRRSPGYPPETHHISGVWARPFPSRWVTFAGSCRVSFPLA